VSKSFESMAWCSAAVSPTPLKPMKRVLPTFLFLTDVLPRAIKKYGGIDSDALRKAALDTDIPEGGTMLGFGVKFEGEGKPMAGQNDRAFPVIIQYVDDKSYVVWPKSQAQREATLPLPAGSTYSNK
jgi:branched-chain amino acid transport system substrate-binding protein